MLEPRKKRALDPFLDKKLAAYTLAGAASLGALAVSPAEAAIVYTSAKESGNTYKQLPVIYSIDLNHDGIVDFQLIANGTLAPNSVGSKFESVNVALYGMNHNSVALVPSAESSFAKKAKVREGGKQDAPQLVFVPPAEALAFGSEVAPQLEFGNGGFLVQLVSIGLSSAGGGGEFCNQRNKFLGLRFAVEGKIYYGWARVRVKAVGMVEEAGVCVVANPSKDPTLAFELVDYAYQDIPNLPILAGQGIPNPETALLNSPAPEPLAGSGVEQTPRQPASLGLLAYGADAISAWRR